MNKEYFQPKETVDKILNKKYDREYLLNSNNLHKIMKPIRKVM